MARDVLRHRRSASLLALWMVCCWAALTAAVTRTGATPVHAAALAADNQSPLYTLDGWGGVHPVGSSPPLSASAYWQGWDIARGLALNSTGSGGYVVDGWGGIHPVGS